MDTVGDAEAQRYLLRSMPDDTVCYGSCQEIYTIIAPPYCPYKCLRQQTAVPTRNFTLPTTHHTTTRRWEGSVRTRQVSEKNSWFSYAAQRESEADHAQYARQRRTAGREQQSTARPLTTSHGTQHTVVPKAHRKTISQMSMLASSPESTVDNTCVEPQQKIVSASIPRGGVPHTYHRQRHLFPFQRHLRIRIQKHVVSQRQLDGAACSRSARNHMSPTIFTHTYRKNGNAAHSRDAHSKIQTMNLQRAQRA